MASQTTRSERIANRVEAEMVAQGITLHGLSARAHIPRTTLRNQLAGAQQFKVDQLFRVCQVLGFTPAELFRDIEDAA